jgi:hypothetical protein
MKNDWVKGENWVAGDIIVCIDDVSPAITIGKQYKILLSTILKIMLIDDFDAPITFYHIENEMECFDLLSNIRQNRLDLILDENNIS